MPHRTAIIALAAASLFAPCSALAQIPADVLEALRRQQQPFTGTVRAHYQSSGGRGGNEYAYDGATGAHYKIQNNKFFGVDAQGNDFKGDADRYEVGEVDHVRTYFADSLKDLFPRFYTTLLLENPGRVTRTDRLEHGGYRFFVDDLLVGAPHHMDPERAKLWPFPAGPGDFGSLTVETDARGIPTRVVIDHGPNKDAITTHEFTYAQDSRPEFPVADTFYTMKLVSLEYTESRPEEFTMEAVFQRARAFNAEHRPRTSMMLVAKDAPIQLSPESDVTLVPQEHRKQAERLTRESHPHAPGPSFPLFARWPLIVTGVLLIAGGVWYRVKHGT